MKKPDPLNVLSQSDDAPVTPRPAFADQLRARLLVELGSNAAVAENEASLPRDNAIHIQTSPELKLHHRRPSIRRTIEIAAVLVLTIGFIAAFFPYRSDTNQVPSALETSQTMSPSSVTSPTVEQSPGSDRAIVWSANPEGDPVSHTLVAPLYDQSVAVEGGRVFRLVSTSLFEGIEAFDAVDGAPLWRHARGPGADGQLETGSGLVFYLSRPPIAPMLKAIDQVTGEEIWNLAPPISAIAILHEGEAIYLWDGKSRIIALDAMTGELLAERTVGRETTGGPQISFDPRRLGPSLMSADGALIVISVEGFVAVLTAENFATADLRWQIEMDAIGAGLAVSDGVVAATFWFESLSQGILALNGQAFGLDLSDGEILWQSSAERNAGIPMALEQGFAISCSSLLTPAAALSAKAGETRAVDSRTGQMRWTMTDFVPSGVSVDGSITFGVVVDSNDDQRIVALSSNEGELLGELALGAFEGYQHLESDEVHLYAVDGTNVLVAIEIEELIHQRDD